MRDDHVTISAIDDGQTLRAKTIVLPGPVDPDARRLVGRFGRVIRAPVVNLTVSAESVGLVSDTAFGEPVGICVGRVDQAKPIDVVLFVTPPGGVESIDPTDDCSLNRKDVSYRQLIAAALSSTQRFAVFAHAEHSYFLTIDIHTHLLHKDQIVLDVYEIRVNPRRASGLTPAPTTPPAAAAPTAAEPSGIRWSSSCVTNDGPPTFTLTQGHLLVTLQKFGADIRPGPATSTEFPDAPLAGQGLAPAATRVSPRRQVRYHHFTGRRIASSVRATRRIAGLTSPTRPAHLQQLRRVASTCRRSPVRTPVINGAASAAGRLRDTANVTVTP